MFRAWPDPFLHAWSGSDHQPTNEVSRNSHPGPAQPSCSRRRAVLSACSKRPSSASRQLILRLCHQLLDLGLVCSPLVTKECLPFCLHQSRKLLLFDQTQPFLFKQQPLVSNPENSSGKRTSPARSCGPWLLSVRGKASARRSRGGKKVLSRAMTSSATLLG